MNVPFRSQIVKKGSAPFSGIANVVPMPEYADETPVEKLLAIAGKHRCERVPFSDRIVKRIIHVARYV